VADMENEWLTYQQAAERLGCSPEAIRQKAIRGRWQKTIGNDTHPPEIFSGDGFLQFPAFYGVYSMGEGAAIKFAPGGSAAGFSETIIGGAIPEPSTWAMLMLGFGFIAWVQITPRMRRRKRPGARISDVPKPPTM
jgi:hypothetical protein